MKDPLDIVRLYEELEKVHTKYPQLRFCQLISDVVADYLQQTNDIFYLEDDKFLEYLREWNRWMNRR